MVGMFVGVKNAIEPIDISPQKLLAQIGRGVDQNAGDAVARAPFDQERRAPPSILKIVRIAMAPAQSRPRHTTRRTTAKNRKFHRHRDAAGTCWLRADCARAGDGTLANSR